MKQNEFKETEIGLIPGDWEVETIGDSSVDIIDGDRGVNYPKKTEFEKEGFCLFLNTKNVPGERFELSESVFIDKQKDEILRKGKLQRGDLVLTTRGSLGNVAYYNHIVPYQHVRINSGMIIVRNLEKTFHTYFLYLLLRSPLLKRQYLSFATGSAQPQLPIRDIKKIKLAVPPLAEQKAIVKILSNLDSKIELNNEMNKTLEAIGQALFKHWFVDFEFPNNEGKPYKSSGGEMVDSELGDIPEGWEVGKISDVIKILSGFAFKSSYFVENGEYHLVTIKNVQDGYLDLSKTSFLNYLPEGMANHCLLKIGDILLSLTGNVGRCCLVNDENLLLNQRVAKLQARNIRDSAYTYTLFRQQTMKRTLENAAKGTAQANLSPIETANMEIQVPPNELLEFFSKRATPLLGKILKNKSKITTLENLRDTLLPKLMSGAVRVRFQ